MNPRSFDAITKRAVRRMVDNCDGDMRTILRIHAKARDMREWRAVKAFFDALRRPHTSQAA